jgi:teichoic acid transport system ATP-binding protein
MTKINDSDKLVKIKATYLSKQFEIAKKKSDKLKSLFKFWKNDNDHFWALRNVNFECYDGDSVGIIGLNGSGKSTFSNIVSGQLVQTSGQLEVNGQTSIIAIGAGLKANLTGRENIRLKGLMMGQSKREIEEKMDDIIDFSELGSFIDQPVKDYSAGMKSKLGFSIMVNQDPDILIIDEALSVGDKTFAKKSKDKMLEFRDQGKTILFVSHSMSQIREMCNKVLWIHYGEVMAFGETEEVLEQYEAFNKDFAAKTKKSQKEYKDGYRELQLSLDADQLVDQAELMERERNGASAMSRAQLIDIIKQKPLGAAMSWVSVLGVIALLVVMLFCLMTASSNKNFKWVVEHPIQTITDGHIFKAKDIVVEANNMKKGDK